LLQLFFGTFVLFAFCLTYFYSVSGYGKILNNSNSNFFELQFDGSIILLLIGYFIYLSIGINFFINFLILITGLILYFFYKKKINNVGFNYIIILFGLLFLVLLISKTHEDFNLYHYFAIHEVFSNNLRIGISKLNGYFIHSSHLILNQALTILPFIGFKLVHIPVFIIYVSTLGYFLVVVFNKNSKGDELFFSTVVILVLLVKFNRLSEFGYDYIAQFILIISFHKIFFLNSNNNEIIKGLKYFIFSILIKPISLLFTPILFFIIYKKGLYFYKKISLKKYFLFSLLIITIFSSSFFKTGCLFYPINLSCFSKEKINWSDKESLKDYSKVIILWAKSYDAQDKSKYQKISDTKLYLKNFNWVKYWIESHFFYKIFEFLIIVSLSIFLIYFYFIKTRSNIDKNYTDKKILFFFLCLSIFFWFNTVPQFRFGFSSILIFVYIFLNFFFNLSIKFNKKKFIYLFIFGLLILNFKNINRINNEFSRTDFYKYTNFPFFNEKPIKYDYSKLKKEKFLHIEILK